ncbi:MAG: SulP family sulfate permease [Rhodothermales bacterium]
MRADILAGLTVGVMLIPQGMAYALVAGLPPIYGLYAGLAPLLIYSLFGTSRHLAVGPVAMISLLVATSVAPLAGGDAARYLELAILLSLLSGGFLLAFGVLQAGFLASFLSHPVLTGFTGAAAIIIGSSQLRHVLGVDLPSGEGAARTIWSAIGHIPEANLFALAFAAGGILILVLAKMSRKRLPGALIVVVAGTLLSWLFRDAISGLSLIGAIPAGLPAASLPSLSAVDAKSLVPAALVIALVGYMESIAIAKSMAHRHGYRIDASGELRALGLANIAGAFLQAFPTTGGLSRTAVNEQAGARSNLAGIVAALVVVLVLLFLTASFYYLPKAVLGAIILVAVAGLVDIREFRRLWRVSKSEFGLAALTAAATLFMSVEAGILIGVVASLAIVVQRSSRPHTAVLGRLPGTSTFRNIARNTEAETIPEILAYRIDASLYFANIEFITDQVLELLKDAPGVRALVLDLYAVNRIDSTAEHGLEELIAVLARRKVKTVFAGLKGPVRDTLEAAGMLASGEGPDSYADVQSAVNALTIAPLHS